MTAHPQRAVTCDLPACQTSHAQHQSCTTSIKLTLSKIVDILNHCRIPKKRRWRPPASHVRSSAMLFLLVVLMSRVIPEKLAVPQLVTQFPAFYETQRSLQHLQKPPTCPYPEPDQSRPCPITLLEDPFNIILPLTPRSSKWSLSLSLPIETLYAPLSPIRSTCAAHFILDLITYLLVIEIFKKSLWVTSNDIQFTVRSVWISKLVQT